MCIEISGYRDIGFDCIGMRTDDTRGQVHTRLADQALSERKMEKQRRKVEKQRRKVEKQRRRAEGAGWRETGDNDRSRASANLLLSLIFLVKL